MLHEQERTRILKGISFDNSFLFRFLIVASPIHRHDHPEFLFCQVRSSMKGSWYSVTFESGNVLLLVHPSVMRLNRLLRRVRGCGFSKSSNVASGVIPKPDAYVESEQRKYRHKSGSDLDPHERSLFRTSCQRFICRRREVPLVNRGTYVGLAPI